MKDIWEKDFEYYEDRASYFAYTHNAEDDYDIDEYLELERKENGDEG